MIWNDEIVEEMRRARDEHAAEFNYDISAICADIRRKQKEGGRKVITLEERESEFEKMIWRRLLNAIRFFRDRTPTLQSWRIKKCGVVNRRVYE